MSPPCPPPEVLAGAARALQLEAARWARLRVGEELVCQWRLAAPAAVTRGAASHEQARPAVTYPFNER